jgi:hypothetical protein
MGTMLYNFLCVAKRRKLWGMHPNGKLVLSFESYCTENFLNLFSSYFHGLRLLFYRMSIVISCINSSIPLWKKAFGNVLRLEYTYLSAVLEAILKKLPTFPDRSWRSDALDEWLLVTYFIRYMQSEKDDWDEFFNSGKSFEDVDATSLGTYWIHLN